MRLSLARILSVLVMLTMFVTMAGVPQEAQAKSNKATYSISVNNINSDTVLRKGTKLKIKSSATVTKNGARKRTPVMYKSSKSKVASVSGKGVIKAKKKGTTYITVYCKKKTSKKKKIRIRVGTPVSSISVSGSRYLNRGRSSTLKASVNSSATNKRVTWRSDNSAVATVNSSGKVTAKGYGSCNIYATATDGSGVSGSRTIVVHHYTRDEAYWIAHRGFHTKYTENTSNAFKAAGQNGFWGCECDVWETRHDTYNVVLPDLPVPIETTGFKTEEDEEVAAVINAINALLLEDIYNSEGDLDTDAVLDNSAEIKSVFALYDALDDGQKYEVRAALMTDATNTDEGLLTFLNAYAKVYEYESYDIVINHDETFSRTMDYSAEVKSMSADEIKSELPAVCFLNGYDSNGIHVEGYLDICKRYNMVPVIELKDPDMSREAVIKIVKMVESKGLQDNAVYISFFTEPLSTAKEYAEKTLGTNNSKTYYLFSSDVMSNVKMASDKEYTGVSVDIREFTDAMYNKAKEYGLGVGTWTYKNNLSSDNYLFEHVASGKYQLDFVTLDHKAFN